MTLKIGINPLTWTNDDMPELGADTPLEVCLAEGARAGYAGFELGNKFPREADVLGPILDGFGLELVSGWYSSNLLQRSAEQEIAAIQSHLRLLRSLGSSVMVFAETTGAVHGEMNTPVTQRPQMSDSEWATLMRRIQKVGDYLAEQGVHLAYHHHMGTVVESQQDIDRLMSGTGSAVGLLLDTGHLTYAGGDVLQVIEDHGSRIVHVHCKDIRAGVLAVSKRENLSFLKSVLAGVFTVPGDGHIDYPAMHAALQEQAYKGWYVVEAEQDPAIATPYTYARMGFEYLSSVVESVA